MEIIALELVVDIATFVLAGVASVATWLHHKHKKRELAQRERHHQERMKQT